MSLVRLLTAGKSLVGLKESGNRYRLADKGLLPKFQPKKNPFMPGTPASPEAAADVAPAPEPETADAAAAEPRPEKTSPEIEAAESLSGKAGGSTVPSGIQRLWAGCRERCKSMLGRLFSWRRSLPARSTAPGQSRKMFQAELSLETVKVVRNDLTDTDLEVVSCSRKPPEKTEAGQGENESAANRGWAGMAGSLFGAGKE